MGGLRSRYRRAGTRAYVVQLLTHVLLASRPPFQEELKGAIEFRNVDFTYEGRNQAVFQGLQLSIPACSVIGVVGSSGSGKSTLGALISR